MRGGVSFFLILFFYHHQSSITSFRHSIDSSSYSTSSSISSTPTIPPIDIVITYIQQPTKEQYESIIKSYCPSSIGHNIQRFRDTGTLYYTIKSILKYLPWIHHIYLVLNDYDHICWLNIHDNNNNTKITIIRHHEIWLKDNLHELPTFNSIAIERYLHLIPNLSEYFIYLNDDMLIGTYLSPTLFFNFQKDDHDPDAATTTPRLVPYVWVKDLFWLPYELLEEENFIWGRDLNYSLNMSDGFILTNYYYPTNHTNPRPFPGAYMGTHGPYICTKSLATHVQSLWPTYFDNLSSQRCRNDQNLKSSKLYNTNDRGNNFIPPYRPPFWIYQWYFLVSNISIPIESIVPFSNMFTHPSEFYHNILTAEKPINFFILNDDYSTHPIKFDIEMQQQQHFLEQYYDYDSVNQYHVDKIIEYSHCDLVQDQSHLSLQQKREYYELEQSTFIQHSRSGNYSKSRLHWMYRDMVGNSRESDEWIIATSIISSVNTSNSGLYLHNFSTSPVYVGHFTSSRESSLSGPLSFEGISTLSSSTASSRNQHREEFVDLSLLVYIETEKGWNISCSHISSTMKQQNISNSQGIIIFVTGIELSPSTQTSSLHLLAKCLKLNYIRANDETSADWGVLSSYLLRDIRRYDLISVKKEITPILSLSIPVTTPASRISSRLHRNYSKYHPSIYRNTVWLDIWYLNYGKPPQQKRNLRTVGSNQPLHAVGLSDLIKFRQARRLSFPFKYGHTFGSIFVGVGHSPTSISPNLLQNLINHKYKSYTPTNKCKNDLHASIIIGVDGIHSSIEDNLDNPASDNCSQIFFTHARVYKTL